MPKVNISVTAVVPFVIAQKHKRQYRLAVFFSSRIPRSQRAKQVIQHRCQSKIAFITSWNEDNLMNVQQLLEFSLSLFLPFILSLMHTSFYLFIPLSLFHAHIFPFFSFSPSFMSLSWCLYISPRTSFIPAVSLPLLLVTFII